tara:strand:+ start:290 stop:478 length:189 start_codon:yes stop_codon:yes gene_type:complete
MTQKNERIKFFFLLATSILKKYSSVKKLIVITSIFFKIFFVMPDISGMVSMEKLTKETTIIA